MNALRGNPKTTAAGIGGLVGVLLKIFGPQIGIELEADTWNTLIALLFGGGLMAGGDGD